MVCKYSCTVLLKANKAWDLLHVKEIVKIIVFNKVIKKEQKKSLLGMCVTRQINDTAAANRR